MLFWGHNPLNSGPDGETRFNVREALDHNPKIIVVDPRETELAAPRRGLAAAAPGTDDALALRMLNVIIGEELYDKPFVERWTHGFDALREHVRTFTPEWAEPITWVAAEKIRAAARLFARTKPAMLEWGCAIEHTPNCIQTIRALSMLPAITGNVDVPGGWVFGMHGIGRFPSLIENLTPEANAKRLGADRFKLLGGEGADLPAAHIPTLLQAMREGTPYPVKAFLVFGNNTLTTYANSRAGLRVADEARLHGLRRPVHDADGRARRHRPAGGVVARDRPDRRAANRRRQRCAGKSARRCASASACRMKRSSSRWRGG